MQNFLKLDISSMTNVLFARLEQETLCHFLFYCQHSNMLWKNDEQYYLTITKEFHALYLREAIIRITMSKCPLFNYLILIGKLYLSDCRKKQVSVLFFVLFCFVFLYVCLCFCFISDCTVNKCKFLLYLHN